MDHTMRHICVLPTQAMVLCLNPYLNPFLTAVCYDSCAAQVTSSAQRTKKARVDKNMSVMASDTGRMFSAAGVL